METKTYAIVLDTNSFGKINKYNFNKSGVTICLNALMDYSNIKVFMPSIVYEELKKHIKQTIKEVKETISSSYVRTYIDMKEIESIYDKKLKELDTLIKKYKVDIIDSNKYSDIAQINEWYFNGEKPFTIEKPKEFPDAMIISSTINYFKENKFDEVIMISQDKGVIDSIKSKTDFKVNGTIQSVLNELTGQTEEDYRKCEEYIISNDILSDIDSYSFYSYDSEDEYEIDTIEYKIDNIKIIDKDEENKYIQVCVNCNLKIYGEFNFIDPNMSYYDRENPECSVYFYRIGRELNATNIDVFITIKYDNKNNFKDYEVTKVEDIILNDYINQLDLRDYNL